MFARCSRPFWLILLLLALPLLTLAQNDESVPLAMSRVGLYDVDGSVLYSVLLQSNEAALNDLSISSLLPEGASFVDVFWTPESAAFEGESNGEVRWTLESLPANSVIGPFTYRVTFNGEETIPYHVPPYVTWSEWEIHEEFDDVALPVPAPSGSITVDQAGTDGLAQVEATGVYMYVPEGAYNQDATFTFERLLILDDTPMPQVGLDLWWGALFNVTVEPENVEAAEPILIFFPTRRTLTPDMPVFNFIQVSGGEWKRLPAPSGYCHHSPSRS